MNKIQQTIKESEEEFDKYIKLKYPHAKKYVGVSKELDKIRGFIHNNPTKLIESIIEEVESKWKKLKSFEGKNWNKTFGYNEALQDIKQLLKDSIK